MKILADLLMFSILTDGLLIRNFFPFDFYYYYIFFIVIIFFAFLKYNKLIFGPKKIIYPLTIFFIINVVTGIILNSVGFLIYKQIIIFYFSAISYYLIFKIYNFDIEKIIFKFINISFIHSLIALFFFLIALLNLGHFGVLEGGVFGTFKIYGLTQEPFFFAVSLIPSVYYFISNLGKIIDSNKKFEFVKFFVVLISFLLSGSSTGYLFLGLMLLFFIYDKNLFRLKSLNLSLFLISISFLFFLYKTLSESLPGFNERFVDTFKAFNISDNNIKNIGHEINGSSFALFSNFQIAKKSFFNNPFSGSGIGTHELNYSKYYLEIFPDPSIIERFGFELNKEDGNSLFIRLVSETGSLGILFFLAFISSFLIKKKSISFNYKEHRLFAIINHGILIMILARALRSGNYMGNGMMFFAFLYFYTYLLSKQYHNVKQKLID